MHEREAIVAVAGRLFASLGVATGVVPLADAWGDTSVDLPRVAAGTRIANVLTSHTLVADGGPLRLSRLFADFPGALLHLTSA